MKSELYGIQMLRGVAAIAVVCHHTLEESNGAVGRFSPNWLTTCGAAGVDIFFVISGFIMLYRNAGLDSGAESPIEFILKRMIRIYPIYWLCCACVLLISAMGFLASHRFSLNTVFISLLLLPGSKLIYVSWTLVYEIYFYLLFCLFMGFRDSLILIIGIAAAGTLIFLLSGLIPFEDYSSFFGNPIPAEFIFGLVLAYAYSATLRHKYRWPVPFFGAVIGFILLIVAPLFVNHSDTTGLPSTIRIIAWGLPATLVAGGFLSISVAEGIKSRALIALGDASYSIYLTHVFVMIAYGRIIKDADFSNLSQIPVVPVVVLLAIAVGVATHVYVEKPIMRTLRRATNFRAQQGVDA